ncbi:hypothetical protein FLJC2902T_09730 [Flavobacterium limnosediminis JC2902]|uniref:Uncharacterized protein n=1 Tax=Flavobacterium limnosediminis JC2902 TaxID=1341181 RepID=V6SQL9_9FLAO|nr:hypothetical protein [Flavobacterium limnosediminis]ESU28941.1 hypothetical protein FLJC2902T_09730 [Flavobacterium limnosediminis JC2902]
MRKYVLLLGAVGAVLIAFAFTTNAKENDKAHKVTICHYPPGNPGNVQKITISTNAVEKHIENHGDVVLEDPCDPCPCREEQNPY